MKDKHLEERFNKLEKRNKQLGITLVALVITMIVMLIMAGIVVAQLSGNGLFDRAKVSKQKYKDAEDLQNSILEGYQNEIESVGSSRDVYEANPIGTVISVMAKDEDGKRPNGYLVCNGATYPIDGEYKNLAEYIKTQFGSYDYFKIGSETVEAGKFKVPDLRGEFLRGTGTNGHSWTDLYGNTQREGGGVAVGLHQAGTQHTAIWANDTRTIVANSITGAMPQYDSFTSINMKPTRVSSNSSQNNSMGAFFTSRPTSTSVLYCIKY